MDTAPCDVCAGLAPGEEADVLCVQHAKEFWPDDRSATIWDELAPQFDVPEFGAEPLPVPSFADAE